MENNRMNAKAVLCQNCGGVLRFDAGTGMLKCDHCVSYFSPEEHESKTQLSDTESDELYSSGCFSLEEAEELSGYCCSSCGAELFADKNTAALNCPYCGNNTVVPAQFSGDIRPKYIIPFAWTKKQAIQSYHDYYQAHILKRLLQPLSFRKNNQIEKIQGVYVPFWLFNGQAKVDAVYETYEVIAKTKNYERRKVYCEMYKTGMDFCNVPADASRRMQDSLMDSIEPYYFDRIEEFSLSYLPGFLAERFDVDQAAGRYRAKTRVENTAKARTREMRNHTNIQTIQKEKVEVNFDEAQYALLPVWLLTSTWNNERYTFAMNGQTGKITGNLPVSRFMKIFMSVLPVLLPLLLCRGVQPAISGLIVAALCSYLFNHKIDEIMKPVERAQRAELSVKEHVKMEEWREVYMGESRKSSGVANTVR